jgi:hypothetical protein
MLTWLIVVPILLVAAAIGVAVWADASYPPSRGCGCLRCAHKLKKQREETREP